VVFGNPLYRLCFGRATVENVVGNYTEIPYVAVPRKLRKLASRLMLKFGSTAYSDSVKNRACLTENSGKE